MPGSTEPSGRAAASGHPLLAHVPLVGHVRRVLETRPDHRAPEERFVGELEDSMRKEDAEAVLATAIEWGRYAEVFAYDYNSGVCRSNLPTMRSRPVRQLGAPKARRRARVRLREYEREYVSPARFRRCNRAFAAGARVGSLNAAGRCGRTGRECRARLTHRTG